MSSLFLCKNVISFSMSTNKDEIIILVHGLWMKGPELSYIRYKLWRQGYKIYQFHYASIFKTPEENADKLFEFISKIDVPVIHFVAHSLGGIVVEHLLDKYELNQSGRVVLIGAPINGSAVAAYLSKTKYLKYLLGKSIIKGLLGDAPNWNYKRKICVIAGTKGIGIGKLLAGKILQQPNDGTVNLHETQLTRADEFHEIPRSHFLLLVSNKVINIIVDFLSKK